METRIKAPVQYTFAEVGRKAIRRLVRSFDFNGDKDGDTSEVWCSNLAVEIPDVLDKLVGARPTDNLSMFRDEIDAAMCRVKRSGVKMGGGASMEMLYHISEGISARKIFETGVAFGWSTLALLLSAKNRNGAHVYSTNLHYPFRRGASWVGCAVPSHLRKSWSLYEGPDRYGIPKAISKIGKIDLVHYDSDKSIAGKKWAFPKLWDALRPRGIFIVDDVQDDFFFKDYAYQQGCKPFIVRIETDSGVKYSGLLSKPENPLPEG